MGPAMDTTMIEAPAAGFLAALRLADSTLPTGLFTQSHGLEAYVNAGRVQNGHDVRAVLADLLEEQIAPTDAVATACAWRAAAANSLDEVIAVDQNLDALKLCREPREGSARSGGRLLLLAADLTGSSLLHQLVLKVRAGEIPGHYATMAGASGHALGVPMDVLLLVELYSFSASFLGAAMRLLRYSHMEAQHALSELQPVMIRLVKEVRDRELVEMRSFGPLAEIMSMHHERGRLRMFSS